jgi:hypothetical protein
MISINVLPGAEQVETERGDCLRSGGSAKNKADDQRPKGSSDSVSRSSVALDNLRAFVILIVLAFHSALAYLQWNSERSMSLNGDPSAC